MEVDGADSIVFTWVVEYFLEKAFREFQTHLDVTKNITMMEGILSWGEKLLVESQFSNRDTLNDVTDRLRLLLILNRLSWGENYKFQFNGMEEGETVLENTLKLVNVLESTEVDNKSFVDDLKKQAVFLPCRSGDFDTAERVFRSLYPESCGAPVEDLEILHHVLEAKSAESAHLVQASYVDFLGKAAAWMQEIIGKYPESFLGKLASEENVPGKELVRTSTPSPSIDTLVNGDSTDNRCQQMMEELQPDSSLILLLEDCQAMNKTSSGNNQNIEMSKSSHSKMVSESIIEISAENRQFENDMETDSDATILLTDDGQMDAGENGLKASDGPSIQCINGSHGKLLAGYMENADGFSRGNELVDTNKDSEVHGQNKAGLEENNTETSSINNATNNGDDGTSSQENDDGSFDDFLAREDEVFGLATFKALHYHVPHRKNVGSCKKNHSNHASPRCKRGPWTMDENVRLFQAVKILGKGKWQGIQKAANLMRTSQQIRDRWRSIESHDSLYNSLASMCSNHTV